MSVLPRLFRCANSRRSLLFTATAKGADDFVGIRQCRTGGIKGVKLADDDHLVGVAVTGGEDEIILATARSGDPF